MTINLKTFVYRACPRCHGDLQLDRQSEEYDYTCVQCGRSLTLRALLASLQQLHQTQASEAGSLVGGGSRRV